MKLSEALEKLSNTRGLKRQELLKYNKFASRYANKRITELKKRGLDDSRALRELRKAGIDRFVVSTDMGFNQLRTQAKQLYIFMSSKTSLVNQARQDQKHRQEFFASMGRDIVDSETENWKRVDDIFYELWKSGMAQQFYAPSDLKREIVDYVYGIESRTNEEIIKNFEDKFQEMRGKVNGTDKPFYTDSSDSTSPFFRGK